MRLRRTSLLPCTSQRLVEELSKPALLDHVAAPMLVFQPVDPAQPGVRWSEQKYRFRLLVGGRLPIGEHTINVRRTLDADHAVAVGEVMVWHDAGYSDLIKVWDHKVLLEDVEEKTRYTDLVEVHAGPLTVPAYLFASAFYAHRQRRLMRLVNAGFGL